MDGDPEHSVQRSLNDEDEKNKAIQAEEQSDIEPFDLPEDKRPLNGENKRKPVPAGALGADAAAGYLHNVFVG
jgi:hypothetical protein